MKRKEFSIELGGKKLIAEFTDLADQANGSVIIRYGNTVILATAVMAPHEREGLHYFPLTVDYEEKFYAAGKILGSRFMRREGRPSEEAILSGRVVDRTIRPLFDQYIRNEVQVVITILSIDEDDPDVLAVIGASLALSTSDIPWNGPVSAVRVGKQKEGSSLEINPTYAERDSGELEYELLACGKDASINMIEVVANESTEKTLTDALVFAVETIEKLQKFQNQIVAEIGKEKKVITQPETSQELAKLFEEKFSSRFKEAIFPGAGKKQTINELKKEWMEAAAEKTPDDNIYIADNYYENRIDELIHHEAIENKDRSDGRALDEVRDLYAKAGDFSPMLHGSGIFYRGGTHVFSALTLGGPNDSLIIDSIEEQGAKKRFMHHYNFPPFSVGEAGRIGGFNRRMTGHGALAEKALTPLLPPKEEFPYTIRIVSECMASNGSTSMASVCASSLALMDAGVPIKRPAAGIAMGLMLKDQSTDTDKQPEYEILTDIQGPEDHHGDMDLKVAGTREGVTAMQMDVKVGGIPIPILAEAFEKAKEARLQILDVIEKEIAAPRPDISPSAPKIVTTSIKASQIGLIIGPGGKTINKIREETETEIEIEEDGTVFITGKGDGPERAAKIISDMTHEFSVGERFTGTVARIVNFGAFVTINNTTDGLVHVSEIAPFRIEKVESVLSVGERVPVVIKEIDDQKRIKLSIKDADPTFVSDKKEQSDKKT